MTRVSARQRLLVVGGITSAVVIAAACSFPDVTFAPAESGASDSPTGDAPSADAPSGDAHPVGANEDVDPTGADADATTVPEGGGRIDAGPDATCCDCDDDGFRGDTGTCKAAGDCDDLSPFVHPNQAFVASASWPSDHMPTYDWDCNGTVVKQYNHGIGTCASHSKLDLNGCGAYVNGFEGDPQCGAIGHYVTGCAADPVLTNLPCKETAGDDRVQGCR